MISHTLRRRQPGQLIEVHWHGGDVRDTLMKAASASENGSETGDFYAKHVVLPWRNVTKTPLFYIYESI